MKAKLIWKIVAGAVFITAFILLFVMGINNIMKAELLNGGWSIRYDEGIDDSLKQQVKRDFIENREENKGTLLNFWTESKTEFSTENYETEAKSFIVDGDAAAVKHESFIAGNCPGELDKTGVAISSELSWRLWGSLDTVGKEVSVDNMLRMVSGVYENEEATAIMSGSPETIWQGAEVSSESPLTREELIQLLSASLLGPPDSLVDGGGIAGLLQLMQYLPLCAAAIIVIVQLLMLQCHGYGKIIKRGIIVFCLLGFALLLPILLSQLPGWLIPSKWSDLTFWARLFETLKGYINEWFALKPSSTDVLLKQCMLLQGLYTMGMLFSLIGIFKRHKSDNGYKISHAA